MPVESAIDALAQIVLQAIARPGVWTMGQKASDGRRGSVEVGEPPGALVHESPNAIQSFARHGRHHIHEHQGSRRRNRVFCGRHQAGDTADRGAHQNRRIRQGSHDRPNVANECVYGIISVGGPRAVSMTAQVQRNHMVVLNRQCFGRTPPRAPRLSGSWSEYDGRSPGIAEFIGGQT
jgi:hypothetical protein